MVELLGLLLIVGLIIFHSRLNEVLKRLKEIEKVEGREKFLLRKALDRLRILEENVEKRLSQSRSIQSNISNIFAETIHRDIHSVENDSAPLESETLLQQPEDIIILPEAERPIGGYSEFGADSGSDMAADIATEPLKETPPRLPTPKPVVASPIEESWETLIGGNILNKIGIGILVFGLGLFLQYNQAAFSPIVKILFGAILGGVMIAIGTYMERSSQNLLFARGLIGGGWAALYFTGYAAHGLEATKIIDDPLIGFLILFSISAGMIAHSLKYGSEAATGLSFFIGFATLMIGPESQFTGIASVLLAISLLVISHNYEWRMLALGGVILLYGAYAVRLGAWEAASPTAKMVFNQIMLTIYWLLFEGFGISSYRKEGFKDHPIKYLFVLNLLGFLLVSQIHWPRANQTPIGIFFWEITILYALSGVARTLLFRPNLTDGFLTKTLFTGNHEDAYFMSAVFGGILLWFILPPVLVAIGWGIIGLMLVEAGLKWPVSLLRFQGHFFTVLSCGRIFLANLMIEGATLGISHRKLTIFPLMLLCYHLYMRGCDEKEKKLLHADDRDFFRFYLNFPTILMAILMRFEFGPSLVVPFWAISSLILLISGKFLKIQDLRIQSIILGFITVIKAFGSDLIDPLGFSVFSGRIVIASITIVCFYACQFLSPPSEENFIITTENLAKALDSCSRWFFSIFASLILAFFFYLEISGSILTTAWAVQGVVLLILGFPLRERILRYSGLFLFLFCILKLFIYDLRELAPQFRILSFIGLGAILIGISWIYSRFREKIKTYL